MRLISQLFKDDQGPSLSEYLWLGLLVAVLVGGAFFLISLGQPDHHTNFRPGSCGC